MFSMPPSGYGLQTRIRLQDCPEWFEGADFNQMAATAYIPIREGVLAELLETRDEIPLLNLQRNLKGCVPSWTRGALGLSASIQAGWRSTTTSLAGPAASKTALENHQIDCFTNSWSWEIASHGLLLWIMR